MQRLMGLIARFGRDEDGVFAVIFGLLAIVLIAVGGAAVDYVALEQTRNRAQVALDAAALALQPEIFETELTQEDIRLRAEALVIDRIGDDRVAATVDTIRINQAEGSLFLSGRFDIPTLFVNLVGVPQMGARFTAEATRKKLALEVMMVLDNSGSMLQQNRMTYLKEAANCATYILFYTDTEADPDNANTCINTADAELVEDVKIGIVPFTMFVNVGASNATADWIDKNGTSPISAQNFDDDDDESTAFAGPVNRLALFGDLANESWRGCVEARPHVSSDPLNANAYLDTDDTAATTTDPKTLYVPQFSPDLPYGYGNQSYITDHPPACRYTGSCTVVTTNSYCTSTQYNDCYSTNTNRSLTGEHVGSLSYCTCSNSPAVSTWTTGSGSSKRYHRTRTWTCSYQYDAQDLTPTELHERLCKYDGASIPSSFSRGPNADCTREPILPLTETPSTVIDTIDDMIAEGGTNIHEGAVWGFRALSPTEPFAQGAAYDEATSKVLILMTDGENTAYNLASDGYCGWTLANFTGNCYFSAYGWPRNHSAGVPRMGPAGTANSELVRQMNERTRQTCENAKAAGITIYTIGLATANVNQSTQAEVEDMLTDCASSSANAHFPSSPTELKGVFEDIANDLAALRLAQ